jgi:hypothetical protein
MWRHRCARQVRRCWRVRFAPALRTKTVKRYREHDYDPIGHDHDNSDERRNWRTWNGIIGGLLIVNAAARQNAIR